MRKLGAIIICTLASLTAVSMAGIFVLQANGMLTLTIPDVKVEFRNYDNTFLFKTSIPRGGNAFYEGETPEKDSTDVYDYTFVSWDKPLDHITEDTVFYAQFQSKMKEFKVTFQNYNHKQLYIDYVQMGCSAEYMGELPTRPSDEKYSYEFTGWDIDFSFVTEDMTVTAQYKKVLADYTVTFLNWDDSVLSVYKVQHGGTAIYEGIKPFRTGVGQTNYEFIGWDKDLDNVEEDMVVHAQFKETGTQYKAEFYNYDGELLYTDYVTVDEAPRYVGPTPQREKTEYYRYVFRGWNIPLKPIEKDTSFVAQFDQIEIKLKVNYFDDDGTHLYKNEVTYGQSSFYGGRTPNKPADAYYTYTFSHWDRDTSFIDEDLDTYAVYDKELRKYKCTFKNYDEQVLYECEVHAGDTAVYMGETPVRSDDIYTIYKFIGWDKETQDITEDTVFHAQYEIYVQGGGGETKYGFVIFCNWDDIDNPLDFDVVEKKGKGIYGELDIPVRPDETIDGRHYTFNFCGWSEDIDCILKWETWAIAQYTAKDDWGYEYYIVSYRDNEYNLLYEDFIRINNQTSIYSSKYNGPDYAFLQPENGFLGWDHNLYEITGSTTVYPKLPEEVEAGLYIK